MTSMISRARTILESRFSSFGSISSTTVLRLLVLVSGLACFVSIAHANVLTGSFSGTAAAGSSFLSLPDGTAMTGSFKLELGYPFELTETDGSTYARYQSFSFDEVADPVHISLAAPSFGYTWDYKGIGFMNLDLYQTDAGQRISFGTAYPKGSAASITLAGGPGSLFDSLDPSAVHRGLLDVSASSAEFYQTAGIGNSIVFNSLSFDTPAVPEPVSSLLLLVGLGVLGLTNRQHCKQG